MVKCWKLFPTARNYAETYYQTLEEVFGVQEELDFDILSRMIKRICKKSKFS